MLLLGINSGSLAEEIRGFLFFFFLIFLRFQSTDGEYPSEEGDYGSVDLL